MTHDSGRTIRLLQSFEAVARHLSVSKAAKEMGVTTSAVSHQLSELRETLGEQLIEKSGRGIVLTEAGTKLAQELNDTFARLHRSVKSTISGHLEGVRIAVCSSFGPGWLAPRFQKMTQHMPDVDFEIVLRQQPPELSDLLADIFITTQAGGPGFWNAVLFEERMVAVGNSERWARDNRVHENPLITTELAPDVLGVDWHEFLKGAGLSTEPLNQKNWIKCSHYILALEMARQGHGVALLPDFLVRSSLSDGTLRQLSDAVVPSGRHYYICIKQSRRQDARLLALANWLKSEATQAA